MSEKPDLNSTPTATYESKTRREVRTEQSLATWKSKPIDYWYVDSFQPVPKVHAIRAAWEPLREDQVYGWHIKQQRADGEFEGGGWSDDDWMRRTLAKENVFTDLPRAVEYARGLIDDCIGALIDRIGELRELEASLDALKAKQ